MIIIVFNTRRKCGGCVCSHRQQADTSVDGEEDKDDTLHELDMGILNLKNKIMKKDDFLALELGTHKPSQMFGPILLLEVEQKVGLISGG